MLSTIARSLFDLQSSVVQANYTATENSNFVHETMTLTFHHLVTCTIWVSTAVDLNLDLESRSRKFSSTRVPTSRYVVRVLVLVLMYTTTKFSASLESLSSRGTSTGKAVPRSSSLTLPLLYT